MPSLMDPMSQHPDTIHGRMLKPSLTSPPQQLRHFHFDPSDHAHQVSDTSPAGGQPVPPQHQKFSIQQQQQQQFQNFVNQQHQFMFGGGALQFQPLLQYPMLIPQQLLMQMQIQQQQQQPFIPATQQPTQPIVWSALSPSTSPPSTSPTTETRTLDPQQIKMPHTQFNMALNLQPLQQQHQQQQQDRATAVGRVLLVSNLAPSKVTTDLLAALFSSYGQVQRVKILYNKQDTALIQFATAHQAASAMRSLHLKLLFNKPVSISISKYNKVNLPKPGVSRNKFTKEFDTQCSIPHNDDEHNPDVIKTAETA